MANLILLLLAANLGASDCRLIGNYKLWDSSGKILYDFSGNQNHAYLQSQENSVIISTDRGQYYSNAYISLPLNYSLFYSNSTTVIGFWCNLLQDSRMVTILDNTQLEHILINLENSYGLLNLSFSSRDGRSKSYSTGLSLSNIYIESWNLIILSISRISENILVQYKNEKSDIEISSQIENISIENVGITCRIGDLNKFIGFLYEIWVFDRELSIDQMLIVSSRGFTRDRLENIIDPYRNSQGYQCNEDCVNIGASCFKNDANSCIAYPSSCKKGCYDLSNPKFTLRCPKNCICELDSEICISCTSEFYLIDNCCVPKSQDNRFLQVLCQEYTNGSCSNCITGYYPCNTGCCICTAFCNICSINTSNILECTLCASNFYILQETDQTRCVSNCPDGYYQVGSVPSKCEKCDSNCIRCDSFTVCSLCVYGYFIKSNVCVQNCGVGYYSNVLSFMCEECSSGCTECSMIGSSIVCSQCDSSTYLKNGICVASCGSGYYSNTINRQCEQCSTNCVTCQYFSSDLKCSMCSSSTYIKNGVCVIECGTGYYTNTTNRLCTECSTSGCDQCGANLICTLCITGLGLQTINSLKVCQVCPSRYYLIAGTCISCSSLCQTCSINTVCTVCVSNANLSFGVCTCKPGFINSANKSCIPNSNFIVASNVMDFNGALVIYFSDYLKYPPTASLFSVQLGSSILYSPSFTITRHSTLFYIYYIDLVNKSLFSGYSNVDIILPADPNKLISQNDIVLITEKVTIYVNSKFNPSLSCASIPNCSICRSIPNKGIYCDSCGTGYCRIIVGYYTCGGCCDNGYFKQYANNDCYPCSVQCGTCDITGCLTCGSGKYLLNKNCVAECGVGYYENTLNNTCTQCMNHCEECINGVNCIRCSVNYVLNSDRSQCISCPEISFYDNGSCTSCPLRCVACLSTSNCSTCIENAEKRTDNLCYCKLGYIYTNSHCIFTEFHAKAKLDLSQKIILTFDKQLMSSLFSTEISLLISGSTYLSDSFSFAELLYRQIYQIQIPNLTYSSLEPFTLNLLKYDIIYAIDQSKLFESCITFYKCPIECEYCTLDYCTSCNAHYFLKDSSCIADCGIAYVANEDARLCQECSDNCKTCEYASTELVCTECMMGHGLELIENRRECVRCIENSYIESSLCITCPVLCSKCESSTLCSSCVENAHIDNRMCVCDEDYRSSSEICEFYRDLHVYAQSVTYGEISIIFDKNLKVFLNQDSIHFSVSDEYDILPTDHLDSYRVKFRTIFYFSSNKIFLYFTDRDSITSVDDQLLYESYIQISVEDTYMCMENCLNCYYEDIQLVCRICSDGYFIVPDDEIYRCSIECPINYYKDTDSYPSECKKCPENCSKCDNNICIECGYDMFRVDNACLTSCGLGYAQNLESRSCELCELDHCKECVIENQKAFCIECLDRSYLGYDGCSACPEMCKTCFDAVNCADCVENAKILNGLCACDEGYMSLDGKCLKTGYSASAEFLSKTEIKLQFSISLMNPLDPTLIQIIIEQYTYDYPQFSLSDIAPYQVYLIDLLAIDISHTDSLQILFKEVQFLQSIENTYLETDTLSLNIPYNFLSTDSSSDPDPDPNYVDQSSYLSQDPQAEELHSKGHTATGYMTGSIMLLSFSSFSALWAFVNTVQMFSLIPLLNVDLPIMLFSFLASLRGYCPVPNLMEFIITIEQPKPTFRAGLLGYKTSQFLYNSGEMLTLFLISVSVQGLMHVLKLIIPIKYSESFISKKIYEFIAEFRWNMFSRLFIESYIEFGIAATIQVIKIKEITNFDSWNQVINVIFGSVTMVRYNQLFVILYPCLLAVFLCKRQNLMNESNFVKKWGMLFQEFKPKNCYYYVYFLVQRFLIIACFFMLNDYPYPQVLLVSIICWTKFYHFIKNRPFINRLENIVNAISEFNLALAYSLILVYLVGDKELLCVVIQWVIIGCVLLSLIVNLGSVLYNLIGFCWRAIKKCKKGNAEVEEERVSFTTRNSTMNDLSFHRRTDKRFSNHLDSQITPQ